MSGGFGLPVLDIAGALGKLGRTYQDSFDAAQQRTAMAKLGEQVQGGNYADAARTAFGAGDVASGLGLLRLSGERRKQQLTLDADADFARGFGGFGVGGPVGAPGGGVAPSGGVPAFLDMGGASGNYLSGLIKRESGGNPNAQASTSSAKGLTQFTDGTWRAVAAQHPELNLTPDGRTDPNQAIRATQAFTSDNADLLRQSKLPVNDASLYSMHFLGAGGGRRFVAGTLANPDMPAASLVQPAQVAANRTIFYNRDGSPKSAGDVMNSFARSFDGGGRGGSQAPAPQVASTDPSFAPQMPAAPVQGMNPGRSQQVAADPQADMPVPNARPAQFQIPQQASGSVAALPAGLSSPQPRAPLQPAPQQPVMPLPSSQDAASSTRGVPVLPAPGGAPGRVMAMPGEGLAAVAASPVDRAFSAQSSAIEQAPVSQRMAFYARAIANPNLSDGPRQIAQTMFKQALDETRMPDGVKEFVWARANGMTQAANPQAYAKEKLRNPGEDLTGQIDARATAAQRYGMQPDSEEYQSYVLDNRPTAERLSPAAKIASETTARREAVISQGLNPDDPRIRDFIISGNLPKENQQQLTAGDRKAINDAEDHALLLDQTLSTLSRAKELNDKIFTGSTAGIRGKIGTTVPGAGYIIDPKAAADTREFGQIMSMEAIKSMSSTLKGATTDREMDRFVEILGDPSTPPDIRKRTLDRMETLAQRQRDLVQARIGQMREGTYYRPGGGASAGAPGGGQSGTPALPALPAPSPSNRPGAGSGTPAAVSAPPAAVQHLRDNPALSAAFDAKYGAGSAAAVLGGR